MQKFTLGRPEKLKSETLISSLFSEGKGQSNFPLKIIYKKIEADKSISPVQVCFSVPKRNIKKATQRNRIKRLLRECYRLNKHSFYENLAKREIKLAIIILYLDKKEHNFHLLYSKLNEALIKVSNAV